jgi:hypothetical protein
MSKLFKLISTFLISISLLFSNLNLSFNLNIEAKTNNNQTISKKTLNKKLSLEYTADRFKTDLNQSQKDAIIKALKKWKLELPIDNKFTVASIANLKSNTDD